MEHLTRWALGFGKPAQGSLTVTSASAVTVTINGVDLVWGTDFFGSTADEVARNLTDAINGNPDTYDATSAICTTHRRSDQLLSVEARRYELKIQLVANELGTSGNAITIVSSSAAVVASGATLAGGTDGPF